MKHTLLIIGMVFLLMGCGGEQFVHTEKSPFIIGKIEKVGDNWKYTRQDWQPTFGNFLATEKQSITVDRPLPFAVGDTLRLWCELD